MSNNPPRETHFSFTEAA